MYIYFKWALLQVWLDARTVRVSPNTGSVLMAFCNLMYFHPVFLVYLSGHELIILIIRSTDTFNSINAVLESPAIALASHIPTISQPCWSPGNAPVFVCVLKSEVHKSEDTLVYKILAFLNMWTIIILSSVAAQLWESVDYYVLSNHTIALPYDAERTIITVKIFMSEIICGVKRAVNVDERSQPETSIVHFPPQMLHLHRSS